MYNYITVLLYYKHPLPQVKLLVIYIKYDEAIHLLLNRDLSSTKPLAITTQFQIKGGNGQYLARKQCSIPLALIPTQRY